MRPLGCRSPCGPLQGLGGKVRQRDPASFASVIQLTNFIRQERRRCRGAVIDAERHPTARRTDSSEEAICRRRFYEEEQEE
jgi:hypothetical protein